MFFLSISKFLKPFFFSYRTNTSRRLLLKIKLKSNTEYLIKKKRRQKLSDMIVWSSRFANITFNKGWKEKPFPKAHISESFRTPKITVKYNTPIKISQVSQKEDHKVDFWYYGLFLTNLNLIFHRM